MKLKTREIDGFLKSPPPAVRVILIYGPDRGLMIERAKAIGKTVVDDLSDPFNVISLSGDQIIEDPARLLDEAQSMSMMGGARLIRVTEAMDGLAAHLKPYLENPSPDNLIVIEAGELSTRSKLRQLCEKNASAAAVPCYVEDERNLSNLIRKELQNANLRANRDAIAWLAVELKGDRLRARAEIDKLITYMGEEKREITLDDALACCGKGSDQSLDDLIFSLTGNNPRKTMRVYNQLLEEGVALISILRACLSHLRRLHLAKARQQQGEDLPQIMNSLSPPVFFKYKDMFAAHTQRWSPSAIEKAMIRLSEIERESKKTGTPSETLCGQTLLSISLR